MISYSVATVVSPVVTKVLVTLVGVGGCGNAWRAGMIEDQFEIERVLASGLVLVSASFLLIVLRYPVLSKLCEVLSDSFVSEVFSILSTDTHCRMGQCGAGGHDGGLGSGQ